MPVNILATILALTLAFLCTPAGAQFQLFRSTGLPDAVEFGSRIENGDLDAARGWLERGLDPNFTGDRVGTGLMIAAWQGNLAMMELFVSKGADVNRTNDLGEQALMHAAWRGQVEAVQWLLARGATINRGAKQWSALHYAAFSGKDEVARHLVERGADIDARSPNGSTPLMMAVYEGKESTVKELLRLGADRKLTNDAGEGALEWAFKHDQLAIARVVGSTEQFAAAANRPRAQWAETTRSQPVTAVAPTEEARAATRPTARAPAAAPDPTRQMREQVEELLRVRKVLEARGLSKDVQAVDRRIALLRFRIAKPGPDYRRPAVLEISADRKAPRNQDTRLLTKEPGK